MAGTTFLLLTALLIHDITCTHSKNKTTSDGDDKIIGGQVADSRKFFYQAYVVSVIDGKTVECGGSIVSQEYILTSSSCVAGATSTKVRVGITNTSEPENNHPFIKGTPIIHPRYNPSTSLDFNIAVIKLDNILTLGKGLWAISLVSSNTPVNEGVNFTVSGWGRTSDSGIKNSPILNSINLTVLPLTECRKNTKLRISNYSFCAKSLVNDGNVCQGDSGNPAIYSTFQQMGIVSSTSSKGCGKEPSVFVNIGHYYIRGWIENRIGF